MDNDDGRGEENRSRILPIDPSVHEKADEQQKDENSVPLMIIALIHLKERRQNM